MQKTINAMNAFWSGKKAAVTVSEQYDDYEIGKIDHFEWVIPDDYQETQKPKLKVVFSEKEDPSDTNLEIIVNVDVFVIKEKNY